MHLSGAGDLGSNPGAGTFLFALFSVSFRSGDRMDALAARDKARWSPDGSS